MTNPASQGTTGGVPSTASTFSLHRPPHGLSLRRIAVLAGVMIAVPFVLDQLLFRSLYLSFLEPESTAGMTVLARSSQRAGYRPDRRNVLILGDSRINEGFSAAIANDIGDPEGLHFTALGLAGTSPRAWYYVLRDLDPQRNRYSAIYLMAETLRDDDLYEDFANRAIDTAYIAPLLTWGDFFSYPQSFTNAAAARTARRAIAFPAASFRSDLLAFMRAPVARLRKVALYEENYSHWIAAYPGRSEALPSVSPPVTAERVLAQVAGPSRTSLEAYFRLHQGSHPGSAQRASAYRLHWFGQIADTYAAMGVTTGVFLVPRGPYHGALNRPVVADGSLRMLERLGTIRLVDTTIAEPLEQPHFFFDDLHLNAAGRKRFSHNLAASIVSQLGH